MAAQLCITGKNVYLNYDQIETRYFNNIYFIFLLFYWIYQINAALVSKGDIVQKHLTYPNSGVY